MTPLEIDILMHYHCRAEDYPNLTPPAQQSALQYFLTNGYLEKTELHEDMPAKTMNYTPTEKLPVYCEALCKVPEPKQVWIVGA